MALEPRGVIQDARSSVDAGTHLELDTALLLLRGRDSSLVRAPLHAPQQPAAGRTGDATFRIFVRGHPLGNETVTVSAPPTAGR